MRLSQPEIDIIRQTIKAHFGENIGIWLFGSRVDNNKRGGDIDLLLSSTAIPVQEMLIRKVRCRNELKTQLGDRKIDLIIETPGDQRPIVESAHAHH